MTVYKKITSRSTCERIYANTKSLAERGAILRPWGHFDSSFSSQNPAQGATKCFCVSSSPDSVLAGGLRPCLTGETYSAPSKPPCCENRREGADGREGL